MFFVVDKEAHNSCVYYIYNNSHLNIIAHKLKRETILSKSHTTSFNRANM